MAAYDRQTKQFVDGQELDAADLMAFQLDTEQAVETAVALTATAPLNFSPSRVLSLSVSGATTGQVLTYNGASVVWATPAAGGGGTSYTPGTGINFVGNVISADIGTGSTQVAAGNHTHSQYVTIASINQPNGVVGLNSFGTFAPTLIAQSGATTGQALAWDGTKYTPTTISGGGGAGATIVETVVTASGTLTPTSSSASVIELFILRSSAALTLTLNNPAVNGKQVWIKREDKTGGSHVITANIDNVANVSTPMNGTLGGETMMLVGSGTSTWRELDDLNTGMLDSDLAPASPLSGTDVIVVRQSSADYRATPIQFAAYVLSNVQSWTTGARPTPSASQYVVGYNTTLGRFDYWDGAAWYQHARSSDFSASVGQLFGGSGTNGVANAIGLGTYLSLIGTTLDAKTSTLAPVINAIPAGSRSLALPGALVASDHNKIVMLTGTTGNLSATSLPDGARIRVYNAATGNATYSGIVGLLGTTALSSGATAEIFVIGSTVYATATTGASIGAATAYSTTLSASTGATSVPVTMTFSPNGSWQSGQTITPSATGTLTGTFATPTGGTFSGGVLTPSVGATVAATIQYTPSSASGTSGTLTSTPAGGLTASAPNAPSYAVAAATATSYTTALSGSSGAVGSAVTATFTPNGAWPGSEAITLTNVGLSGSWGSASGGTLSGSTLTPTAGSSAASAQFTPSGAATGTINSSTSPSITNTSGGQTYTALAAATSFNTTPSTLTTPSGSPGTITFTPSGGVWGPGDQIGLAVSTVAGSMGSVTNGTISGSGPWTITPTVGNSTNVTVAFTPSSSNGTTGTLLISGTSITATTTSIAVSVNTSIPTYPTLTTSGASRLAVWDMNSGLAPNSNIGTTITGITDASGNGHNLTSTVGVTVAETVHGLPAAGFAGQSVASNSGLQGSGSWLAINGSTRTNNFAVIMAWKAKSSMSSVDEYLFSIAKNGTLSGMNVIWTGASGTKRILWRNYVAGGGFGDNYLGSTTVTSNAVHTMVGNYKGHGSGNAWTIDFWMDGTKIVTDYSLGNIGDDTDAWAAVGIGQGTYNLNQGKGPTSWEFLETQIVLSATTVISDSDINLYVAPSTGYLAQKWGT